MLSVLQQTSLGLNGIRCAAGGSIPSREKRFEVATTAIQVANC